MADGFYAIGEIRLRMGDFDGAEEALRTAHGLGRSPQPALARIRLAQGKVKQAEASIKTALSENTWDRASRTKLLPAAVEIFVASGDVAVGSGGRPRSWKRSWKPLIHRPCKRSGMNRGACSFSPRAMPPELAPTCEMRSDVAARSAAPYEVARAGVLLSMALRATHDEDGADLELASAHDAFAKLGAAGDTAQVEKAIQAIRDRRSKPVQARRTFMFTDIVGSTNLAELLGDEGWDQLLKWHDEALRAQFARSGGEVVNSTGDGFFVAFESARQAIDCAIAIQQTLADHRRATGFAPSVRIGLHVAEANLAWRATTRGMGVHVAARVAALGGAGEIIASVETLRGGRAGGVNRSPRGAPQRGGGAGRRSGSFRGCGSGPLE